MATPNTMLNDWVETIWSTDVSQDTFTEVNEKIYPDAGSSLIFEIDGDNIQVWFSFNTSVTSYNWHTSKRYIGVRFRPGSALSLFSSQLNHAWRETVNLLNINFAHSSSLLRLLEQLIVLEKHQQIHAVEDWLLACVTLDQHKAKKWNDLLTKASERLISPYQIAVQSGLTRRTLERNFKKYFGYSPHQLHGLAQIKYARWQLIKPDSRLSNVALNCGFFDQSHFNHVFKQHTQETPLEYRQRKLSQI
ncbi:helix-turn-helix domain-containing protein [Glaciecola sp. 1036]|uniref:helix-turn-helix transcriptional regulator n=1 Tax=Alteromonadaceae TaxID=72275 RepID=UPI003D03DE6C